ISFPRIRSAIMDLGTSIVLRDAGFEQFDVVAGGETAGIPFAAWMSDKLGLPMVYVSKKPKGFGRNAQIEGSLTEGQRVLLVEDLTTDGGSRLKFAEALRTAGAVVEHSFSPFYYCIFPHILHRLAHAGLIVLDPATWLEVPKVSRVDKRCSEWALASSGHFLCQPLKWSAGHTGIAELKR